MISIYETPYKNVHINVSAPLCTVRTSGGFDSGLLLYMVAKTCAEHNPTAEIQPITVVRTNEDQHPEWHRVDNLLMDAVDVLITSVMNESAIVCVRILEIGALRAISCKKYCRSLVVMIAARNFQISLLDIRKFHSFRLYGPGLLRVATIMLSLAILRLGCLGCEAGRILALDV